MDIIDAKNNIEVYEKNIKLHDQYNHMHSSFAFKQACQAERKVLVQRIQNIELQLKQNRG